MTTPFFGVVAWETRRTMLGEAHGSLHRGGLTVYVIKHAHQAFGIDYEGRDRAQSCTYQSERLARSPKIGLAFARDTV